MLGVTAFCIWLALFPISSELFAGIGLIVFAGVWTRFRYRKFFRVGMFTRHELLSVGFFLAISIGLIARYFTGVYSP